MGKHMMAILLLVTSGAGQALADEGMWTFNNPPAAAVKQKYGFEMTPAWLEQVRLASARLAGGCSASFISPHGLVLTNHHCSHQCIQQLSTKDKDYVASGFYAQTAAAEVKCPNLEVNQLLAISDVTARIAAATRGLTDKKFAEARQAEMARIEKECAAGPQDRCDVVTLYNGGRYDLYKYRRFQDVRLVFAPEFAAAFFGGDPDNFMFPRYDLDLSLLRVYQDGRPAPTDRFFKWSPGGAAEGELTFVTGHPGSTSRQLTAAELAFERDQRLLPRLLDLAEIRGLLTEFQNRGPEQKRISTALLFSVENSYKLAKGLEEALRDPSLMARKEQAERRLKTRIAARPELQKQVGPAFEEIARAMPVYANLYRRLVYLEGGPPRFAAPWGLRSELFLIARTLLRAAAELPKPNEVRLREFAVSNLPALEAKLFSPAPIYDELEITTLTYSLTKLREILGPDDPLVRSLLGEKSPAETARELIGGSQLKDLALRRQLYQGGEKAVASSADPMFRLARLVDASARALRRQYEEQVDAPVSKAGQRIADAVFKLDGTNTYPDATFTLRLSYGQVKGYEELGRRVEPFTTMAGAFARHTGRDPFALPASWLAAKNRLKLETPLNFCSSNDIIGGNSGSPVINQKAEIVGLIFDGNIQSLAGDYFYDGTANRAVAVDSRGLLEALDKVYRAERLVREISGKD